MLVRDVMSTNPLTVRASDTLQTALERMLAANCRRLPVVDDKGQLCGVITDRDWRLVANSPLVLRERWQDDMLYQHTTVDTCMTPDPVTVAPDSPLAQAIDLMLSRKISGLPVLDGTQLVGVITVTDLLHVLRDLLPVNPAT